MYKGWFVLVMGLSEYATSYDGKRVLIRTVDEYDPFGNYRHSDKMDVAKRKKVTFDDEGIPLTNYRWGTHYYPITIAQYALQHHALYVTKQELDSYNIFIQMAEYLLGSQDENGGWPVTFDHVFYKGRTELIKAPWYSAMAQGQVLSTLVRAYHITGKKDYIEAAKKGLKLYSIPVELGGVFRRFENKYWFYEEYPTEPASYVLNGYIYALLGLYDVYISCNDELAEKLYKEGIRTLKRVLSLYDLGNRTAYDLTHYTTEGNPPNIAKWAYHATHVLQMSVICCIEPEELMFKETLKRWINYSKGIPSRTN